MMATRKPQSKRYHDRQEQKNLILNKDYLNLELTETIISSMIPLRTAQGREIQNIQNCTYYWHKFIITGGCKYYKDFILKLIIDWVSPYVLIPVQYEKTGTDTCFLARNCSSTIEKIIRADCVIPNPHGEDVKIRIILGFANANESEHGVDITTTIYNVVKKRYNVEENSLNLKDFHNDIDLTSVVFCPLAAPKILQIVVAVIRQAIHQPLVKLSLANNDLCVMQSLESITQFRMSLRSLNLSYNKLDNIEALVVLRPVPLDELNLDNNPLCQQFDEEMEYINKVREFVPTIKVLDGITLNEPGFLQHRRNHLICPEAGPLVDQFLQHYFDAYDLPNRSKLKSLYHEQAMFSITAAYVPGQMTSTNSQLMQYLSESRNLLKLSDYSKTQQLLYRGPDQILAVLARLPTTEHDPFSFTVDCSAYTETMAHFTVTGVFREFQTKLVRSFSRSLVLLCATGGDWQIANETLNVCNATSAQVVAAFKVARPVKAQAAQVMSPADKESMVQIVAQITDMNPGFAIKCLEDSKWDLTKALTVFRDLFKLGKIPPDAFDVGY